MFRAIFLTFFGEYRGGVPHHDHWTEGWELIPATACGRARRRRTAGAAASSEHSGPWPRASRTAPDSASAVPRPRGPAVTTAAREHPVVSK